mgnify:CR=1 FL=1
METTKLFTCEEVNDFPPIGSSFSQYTATFSVSCDADTEYPEVNIHAHKMGIGGMFPLSTKDARALAVQLINAADAVDREVNAAKTQAA